MKRVKQVLIVALSSWWLIGAIGWAIVIHKYPFESVLPTYAE